jgi:hypothetical protein
MALGGNKKVHSWKMASLGALTALFLGFGTAHLQGGVLYSQPTNYFGGYYSQNDTSGTIDPGLDNYATVYDNFTLTFTATVASVSWVGGYVTSDPPMTGVTISIWADNAGVPSYAGSPLYTTGDVSGEANETFLELDLFDNPTYSYSEPINFVATSGAQYWISIVPDVAGTPQWEWESGSGDGISYQDYEGSFSLGLPGSELSVDEAFTLYDVTIPEPVSTALVGGGLALLALASRRFKRPSA